MDSLARLLLEIRFNTYTAMVRIVYGGDLGVEKLAILIRALPGVVRVSTAGHDTKRKVAIFNVKIITQKPPEEAYKLLRKNATERYGEVRSVQINFGTIEKKK